MAGNREKPKPKQPRRGAARCGAVPGAMLAGHTPLTFTVGSRPAPGFLAPGQPRVRDPEPGAQGQDGTEARAPHAEPALAMHYRTRTRSKAATGEGRAGSRRNPRRVATTNDVTQTGVSIGSQQSVPGAGRDEGTCAWDLRSWRMRRVVPGRERTATLRPFACSC